MTKISSSILIFLALFAFVSAEQFQSLNFDQGRLRLRNLEATPTLKTSPFKIDQNAGVAVGLGNDYITKASVDTSKSTDMMLLLYSSATGFCGDCVEFKHFNCDAIKCNYDTNEEKIQRTLAPHFSVTKGYPFSFNVNIGSGDRWALETNALYYTSQTKNVNSVKGSSDTTTRYFQDKQDQYYGFIGLGVDGDSANNFQGDHPLFSIQVNATGSGQLIFGRNASLLDRFLEPQVVSTDGNWAMTAKKVAVGSDSTDLISSTSLILDLQYPGLGLPTQDYNIIFDKMKQRYNLATNSANKDTDYIWTFSGSLESLPDITIDMKSEEDESIIIPPSAYTRKIADNLYAILIAPVDPVASYTPETKVQYAILGWPVLSQFYTVFEQVKSQATVTFYSPPVSRIVPSGGKTIVLITLAALLAVIFVTVAFVKKRESDKSANSDLGVGFRAQQSTY